MTCRPLSYDARPDQMHLMLLTPDMGSAAVLQNMSFRCGEHSGKCVSQAQA